MVALGNTTVDCVAPAPRKISDCPRRTASVSVLTSPPSTLTPEVLLVTSPVVLEPRMNSRRRTRACEFLSVMSGNWQGKGKGTYPTGLLLWY